MRGYVREVRLGVWQVSFDLPPDPVTGRRRRRSVTVRGDRQEAERQRAIIVGKASAGELGEPGTMTLDDLAGEWLELVAATLRPSTMEGYRQKLRLASRWVGGRRVRDLGPRMLTEMYRQMARTHSAVTVTHVHRVLHRMFVDAVRWGIVDRNPAQGAAAPRVERRQLQVWSAAQVAVFLERAASHPCYALFRLALTTGMRRGELLGLRWPRVHLEQGMVDVVAATVIVRGRPTESAPKTAAGRRRIALDAVTVQALAEHRARQAEGRAYFGPNYAEGDWVFCWQDGRPWSPDWVSRQFHGLAFGLPRIRFHDLRHTWATLALEAGVPAKVVSDRLGHAGIAITLDTYTHHVESLDREAADRVAGLIVARDIPRDGSRDRPGTGGVPQPPP